MKWMKFLLQLAFGLVFWGAIIVFAVRHFWPADSDASICGNSLNGDEVINACTRVLAQSSRNATERSLAYGNRAAVYWNRGDVETAISDLDQAILLDQKNANAYALRGEMYLMKKDYEKAKSDVAQAIILDPGSSFAYVIRGHMYQALNDKENAIEAYTEVVRLDDATYKAEGYNGLGIIYAEEYDFKRAVENFSEAIHLKPGFAVAYNNRAKARNAIGDVRGAQDDLAKVKELVK